MKESKNLLQYQGEQWNQVIVHYLIAATVDPHTHTHTQCSSELTCVKPEMVNSSRLVQILRLRATNVGEDEERKRKRKKKTGSIILRLTFIWKTVLTESSLRRKYFYMSANPTGCDVSRGRGQQERNIKFTSCWTHFQVPAFQVCRVKFGQFRHFLPNFV